VSWFRRWLCADCERKQARLREALEIVEAHTPKGSYLQRVAQIALEKKWVTSSSTVTRRRQER
jgi:hypothetical protein